LDNLPTTGSPEGRAFRDLEMEKKILEISQKIGIGAQFGGKYHYFEGFIVNMI
jgi:fumarate hydratase class I